MLWHDRESNLQHSKRAHQPFHRRGVSVTSTYAPHILIFLKADQYNKYIIFSIYRVFLLEKIYNFIYHSYLFNHAFSSVIHLRKMLLESKNVFKIKIKTNIPTSTISYWYASHNCCQGSGMNNVWSSILNRPIVYPVSSYWIFFPVHAINGQIVFYCNIRLTYLRWSRVTCSGQCTYQMHCKWIVLWLQNTFCHGLSN